MIKVKAFEAYSEHLLEEDINSFLAAEGIEDFNQIRIHYSSNEYLDKSDNQKEHYSALIEYKPL
jgi:hypothetical protein